MVYRPRIRITKWSDPLNLKSSRPTWDHLSVQSELVTHLLLIQGQAHWVHSLHSPRPNLSSSPISIPPGARSSLFSPRVSFFLRNPKPFPIFVLGGKEFQIYSITREYKNLYWSISAFFPFKLKILSGKY